VASDTGLYTATQGVAHAPSGSPDPAGLLWGCHPPVSASVHQADLPEPSPPEPAPSHDAAWQLVRAAQQGDRSAFAELYNRYVDVVFRYVLFRVGGDRAMAEDVTSETFLRALRRIETISYQGRDVGAWFVTIARNLVLDHVKSSRHRMEVSTADIVEPPATLNTGGGPEQEVLAAVTNAELLRCIQELNADQRECIVLRFIQGLSVAETARIMQRNEGAIKALQHRAVRRLAQLMPEDLQ
jgi:RNA polymerase sigma-70 factor, ECF subfamily